MATLNVRIDDDVKKAFEAFCCEVGMNVSVAVNMFVKTVVREQRLPFEVSTNPFYSEVNMERIRRGVNALNAGQGVEHELIEVEEVIDYERLRKAIADVESGKATLTEHELVEADDD